MLPCHIPSLTSLLSKNVRGAPLLGRLFFYSKKKKSLVKQCPLSSLSPSFLR
ncbi:hypothetical protein HanRHA438_Chr04g0200361 [Helianthus annuus]|nr:hypothetical protein HanRHA438_Chr04g0200361 [Helianthus annuus]